MSSTTRSSIFKLVDCRRFSAEQKMPSSLSIGNPGPRLNFWGRTSRAARHGFYFDNRSSSLVLCSSIRFSSSLSQPPLRYAVLGAGFAGLSVAWHLLQHSSIGSHLCIDIYDEVGIGGGASGVAGGLLHPYSPKGFQPAFRLGYAKLLWRGAECWKECLKLLDIVEAAVRSRGAYGESQDVDNEDNGIIVWRRGILRPATTLKNVDILNESAQNYLGSCRKELIDRGAAENLVPNISIPFNSAIYMPEAVNIHPQRYLQALLFACKSLAKDMSASGFGGKEINFHKKSIKGLLELSGEYNAVIICLGAKADMLPELTGRLPLRKCRGVVAHLELDGETGEEYGEHSPSILSDAWLAIQGPRKLVMGSTWNWNSINYLPTVSAEEAATALQELLPKASKVYPDISNWTFTGAKGGLRAMPPLTPLGSLPLLGCVDDIVGSNSACRYWLFGGLGARGLLYHAWLGKLIAQAVISCTEDVLPSDLIAWKKTKVLS